jgi:hypothetical protein
MPFVLVACVPDWERFLRDPARAKPQIGKQKADAFCSRLEKSDVKEEEMPLPQLSEEDRKKALEKAAAARKARAQVKDDLKHGKMSPKAALESDDPIITKMKVTDFLKSLPGWGKAKADKTMAELEIAENRRLGGLGANQKASIIELLDKAD